MVFYSGKHRTICAVLQEIIERAEKSDDPVIVSLCEEALGYARRMSDKLQEYKNAKKSIS
jgi:pyrimidine operon attenuation protein/uracil phosphoribosyltransferase